jgi:hypothetical protein
MACKTLFDKQRIPICKSSILPLLLAGDGAGGFERGGSAASRELDVINEKADRTIVSLSHEDDGWKFIGEEAAVASGNDSSSILSRRSRESDI